MHIAILEDEATLAMEVKQYLEQDGHTVKIYADGQALVRMLGRELFDLYVLDWNVPKMNGYEVLNHMRKHLEMTEPVVFLTSTEAEEEIVAALTAGADDYCIKPIKPKEFLARIQSVGRRLGGQSSRGQTRKVILGYSFHPADHVVTFDARSVELTEKEFKLASFLFDEVDRPLARNRILMEVWGGSGDELSRTLDVHIAWIRKKLNIGASGNHLRLTAVYGYGYRLMQTAGEE